MATMRQFTVTFTPCEFTDRGGVSFMLYDPRSKTYSVSATTLAGMQDQVRGLLQSDFRMDASVYVRLADRNARKPAGFDKATNEIRTLRYVPSGPTWIRITHDEWWDKLEVVQPVGHRGDGFLCGEPQDHRGPNGDERYWAYAQRGETFYASTVPLTVAQWAAFNVATIVEVPATVEA